MRGKKQKEKREKEVLFCQPDSLGGKLVHKQRAAGQDVATLSRCHRRRRRTTDPREASGQSDRLALPFAGGGERRFLKVTQQPTRWADARFIRLSGKEPEASKCEWMKPPSHSTDQATATCCYMLAQALANCGSNTLILLQRCFC